MINPVRFIVFIVALAAVHLYLWLRLVRDTGLSKRARNVATLAILALFLTGPASSLEHALSGVARMGPFRVLGFVWLGGSFMLFVALASTELVRGAVGFWSRVKRRAPDPERRVAMARLLGGGAVAAGLGAAVAGAIEARSLVVQRARVTLARLPASLDGFRIAQISDLHVGPSLHRDYVQIVVDRVNALEPDLVVITGDLVDGKVFELADQVAPIASLRAPHGVFFVTGNHEYYVGADAWLAHLATMGIRVLQNERVEIGGPEGSFDLAGVNDDTARHYPNAAPQDIAGALAGRDASRELVLLAHQPRAAAHAARAGVGLQLSGHTHGGQIFPLGVLLLLEQPFVAGLHRFEDTWVYVSCGAGYWGPPYRLGAPPEVAEITLTRA